MSWSKEGHEWEFWSGDIREEDAWPPGAGWEPFANAPADALFVVWRRRAAPETPAETPKERSMEDIKAAVVRGAKVAMSQEAERVILDLVRSVVGAARYDDLVGMIGERGIALLAPVAIHYAATTWPEVVPQASLVATGCTLATEGNVKDAILPLLEQIRPHLGKLAEIGKAAE